MSEYPKAKFYFDGKQIAEIWDEVDERNKGISFEFKSSFHSPFPTLIIGGESCPVDVWTDYDENHTMLVYFNKPSEELIKLRERFFLFGSGKENPAGLLKP